MDEVPFIQRGKLVSPVFYEQFLPIMETVFESLHEFNQTLRGIKVLDALRHLLKMFGFGLAEQREKLHDTPFFLLLLNPYLLVLFTLLDIVHHHEEPV